MKRCGGIAVGRLAAVLALAVTAACASSAQDEQSLALACQLEACECVPKALAAGGKKAQPVLWTEDGKAYCPDSHRLSRGGKSDFVKRYGG